MTTEPIHILAYAGTTSQMGVVVDPTADGTRVIVPRPSWWRAVFCVEWAIVIILGLLASIPIPAVAIGGWHALLDGPLITITFPFVFLSALGYQIFTFRRQRIFDVGSQEVRYGFLIGNSELWQHRWPLHQIGEIKLNKYSGLLLIRVTGKAMPEFFVSKSPEATLEVANALNVALSAMKGTAPVAAQASV